MIQSQLHSDEVNRESVTGMDISITRLSITSGQSNLVAKAASNLEEIFLIV